MSPTAISRGGAPHRRRLRPQAERFTLALENMVVFGSMTRVSQNASMSGADQSVRIGNLAVGWAPGIMLGWDMR